MADGIILGFFAWLSMVFSWKHVPELIKKNLCKNHFYLDLTAGLLSFLMITSVTKSFSGVVGAIFAGLLVNISVRFFPP